MPRKATTRSTSAKSPAPAATPAPDNPCQACEGSGSVAGTARNIRVRGQTAICLTCLGTGEAS